MEEMTAPGRLVDGFGRVVTDLRISVTDRCNFRCRYCMPPEGLPWLPKGEVLTFEEIESVTRVLVGLGIRSIKFTGGEPLMRRELPGLVTRIRALDPSLDLSLTTNGYLLGPAAADLKAAGLDRVTVSCDSLIKHRFADMTLRDALDEVLEGLETAASLGLGPIKVNTVLIKGINEDEAVDFADLARRTGYEIRFIEYMPLDAQDAWNRSDVIASREILDQIHSHFPLEQELKGTGQPARSYRFADGAPGRVAVIPSVTEPFCESCNRLRLTADGQLRACLFSLEESDVRGPLRAGASDDEIAAIAQSCVAAKWAGHQIGQVGFVKPARSMSMIGG